MSKDISDLFSKTKEGLIAFTSGSIFTNILQIISSLTLANFLSPEDYGVFGIINGQIGALIFFTDIGLGEILIQKHEKVSEAELKSYLGVRLLLSFFFALVFFLAFPIVQSYYNLSGEYIAYLSLLGCALILEVLISLPKLILQRKHDFRRMAIIEVYSAVGLYTVQISSSILGFGYYSLFFGMIARSLIAIVLYYHFSKTSPKPSFSLAPFKNKKRLGIAFQLNSLIPTFKSIIHPIILGKFLSVDSMGLIFWSISMVSIPKAIIYHYNSVFFSTLSPLSKRLAEARKLSTQTTAIMIIFIGLIFGLGANMGESLLTLLFPEKWAPAKPFMALAALSIGLYSIRFLANSILSAMGVPALRTRIETLSFCFDLSLTWILCSHYGIKGYFLANLGMNALTLLIAIWYTKRYLEASLAYHFVITLSVCLLGFYTTRFFNYQENIFMSFFIFVTIFIIGHLLFDRKNLRTTLKEILHR